MSRPSTTAMTSAAAKACIVLLTSSQNQSVRASFAVARIVCHGERIATSPTTRYMSSQKTSRPPMRTIVLRSDFRSLAHQCWPRRGEQHLFPVRQHAVQDDREQQDQDDERIHRRVVEIGVGKADLVAHAGAGHDELGPDHADERIRERELRRRQQVGRAEGKRHVQRRFERPQAADQCRLPEHARHAIEAVEDGDDDRDDAEQESDQHLRSVAEAEDEDEQRIEREDRDRVVGGEQRIERLADGLEAVQHRADQRSPRTYARTNASMTLARLLPISG